MRTFILVLMMAFSSTVWAGAVTVPNTFVNGTATNATAMNSNFTAVSAAINDNDSRITALQSAGLSSKQFVGFSNATISPANGLTALTGACRILDGGTAITGARMCTTQEYALTTNFPAAGPVQTQGWIQPVLAVSPRTDNTMDNVSGFIFSLSINSGTCFGWSSSIRGTGMSVTTAGSFTGAVCTTAQAVACCK